jgi:two-component system cell cycle response regulator
MPERQLLWIGPLPDRPLLEQIEAGGLRVLTPRAARPAAADPQVDACVVHLAASQPVAPRDWDAVRAGRPVLWLADDETLECRALAAAEPGDEVARMPASAALFAQRLERLLERQRASLRETRAEQDALTGLLNRRAFGRELRRAIADLMPGDHRAVVIVDLDRFKLINDEHGHQVGDRLLCAVAERLRAGLGPDDHVGRLGGDEFVLLLSRYDAPSLVRDAEHLLAAVAQPLELPGSGRLEVSASAGLATLRPGLTEPQLLRQADHAAYEAKAQGRHRLVHFELIHDGRDDGPDADLQRFTEVTRMFSERMTRMVADMGRQLVDAARLKALQDPLTGANNRGFFNERLPREIARTRRSGLPLAMALLDIDHFHDVNLAHGWPSGDAVLQRFVELATAHIRTVDWLARYGGEEFAIVLPDTDLDTALVVIERVRQAIEAAPFTALDGRAIPVTLSAGVAALRPEHDGALALANAASQACLAAKHGGRNRVLACR